MIELLLEAERALAAGNLGRADQLYHQVADADAHSAIALVGLARVAEARGDVLGAHALARRALEIDPEDAAARRLEAQLGSSLGAPPPGPSSAADIGSRPVDLGSGRRSLLDRLLGRPGRHR